MKLVPNIIPDAKHLMTMKIFPSGLRNGTYRLKRGAVTPIMLVTRIATIAMILRGNALVLSMHEFVESVSHSFGTVEIAGAIAKEIMRRTTTIRFMCCVVVVIFRFGFVLCSKVKGL